VNIFPHFEGLMAARPARRRTWAEIVSSISNSVRLPLPISYWSLAQSEQWSRDPKQRIKPAIEIENPQKKKKFNTMSRIGKKVITLPKGFRSPFMTQALEVKGPQGN